MSSTTPLTDSINNLTTYANSVTGASDTNLSDAVATLASGYGGSGYSIDDINESDITGDITITGSYIKAFRFAYTSITSVNAPNATTINGVFNNGGAPTGSAFAYCQSLQRVSAPLLTTLGMSMFAFCTNLTSVYLPSVTWYDSGPFHRCDKLTVIALPSISGAIKGIGQTGNLTTLDYGGGTSIDAKAFNSSEKLSTLILRNSQVTTLSNVNVFGTSHPFGASGTGGTLYVPSALISAYQSATNWSTILGYSTNSIQAIEGSIYETQYADGTPIT